MKTKKVTAFFICILILFINFFVFNFNASAANATFRLKASSSTVHPGKKLRITVSFDNLKGIFDDQEVKGLASLGPITVTYDSSKLTYSGYVYGTKIPDEWKKAVREDDEGTLTVIIRNDDNSRAALSSDLSDVINLDFWVKDEAEPGEISFSLDCEKFIGPWVEGNDPPSTDFTDRITISSSLAVNIGEKLNTDATLKSLSVTDYELTPDFKASVLKYSIEVDHTVSSVTVKAVANNSKAKVSIDGNKNLKTGNNTIKIVVTAEDTDVKKTYEITVKKASPPASSSEPSSSDTTSSEAPASSDPSGTTSSEVTNSNNTGNSSDITLEQAYQQKIDSLKAQNNALIERMYVIIIIFTAVSLGLLGALLVVSYNYKNDIK